MDLQQRLFYLPFALKRPGTALISSCTKYRYLLTRTWNPNTVTTINFLMCNPSTADANKLDPTVRKCVEWGVLWGYDQLIVTNIFAFRSPYVKTMFEQEDPVGPENNKYIRETFAKCKDYKVVAAWGAKSNPVFKERHNQVLNIASDMGIKLHCLKLTKDGYPSHPLYLSKSTEPIKWNY